MPAEPFQIEGVEFLLDALRAGPEQPPPSRLLADEMGTGKTVQAALALRVREGLPAVIAAPAGVLRNWRRELGHWALRQPVPHVDRRRRQQPERGPRDVVRVADSTRVAKDSAAAALADLAAGMLPAPVLVLSHAVLAEAVKGWSSPLRAFLLSRAVLIVDELHRCKGGETQRGHGLRDAVELVHRGGGACWGLSATPMPRDPLDLWILLKWLRLDAWCFPGGLLSYAEGHFGGRLFLDRWRFPEHVPGGALRQVAPIMLRRRRREVLPAIPPKEHQARLVPIEGASTRTLDRAAREIARAVGLEPDDLAREDLPDALTGLAAGVASRLEALTEARADIAAAKVPALLTWLDELAAADPPPPVAVYSDHRAPIDALRARPGWVVITGDEDDHARQLAVDAFQAGEDLTGAPVIGIGYTAAGREGISINRAEHLIVASASWSADADAQAVDRATRFGRIVPLRVGYLVAAHPVELLQQRVLAAKRRRGEQALGDVTCADQILTCAANDSMAVLPPRVSDPAIDIPRQQWLSHTRLTRRRDCGLSEHARYWLGLLPAHPPENRRLGILFAAAIAGRLLVWARDQAAAAGSEGDAKAAELVREEAKKNPWRQEKTSTEAAGRMAVELSRRTMERFGFFSGRWTPYEFEGRPAVEIELRCDLLAGLEFPSAEARRAAEEALRPPVTFDPWGRPTSFQWAGFYGRADLIAYDSQHRGGTGKPRLTVIDFKCKGSLSSGLSDGADDLQLMLYLRAARALGIPAELAARIETANVLPEEPPRLNSGKLSKDKSNPTDVLLFEQAIKRHGLRREDYEEHLRWLAAEGPKMFSLTQCGRTQAALDQIWREMLFDAVEMTRSRPIRTLRSHRTSPCQSEAWPCEYKELCTATIGGSTSLESYGSDLVRLGKLRYSSRRETPAEHAVQAVDTMAVQEESL